MGVYLEKMVERFFLEIKKDYLQNHFVQTRHWSDEMWKSTTARGGGNKKRFQYCTDSSSESLDLRALQGHSGSNLIDPSSQDNVLIPDDFFKYTYHIGCAINWHSIINSKLIPGGQNLSKKQTTQRSWEDQLGSTASCTVTAYSMEEHENTVYWVDIKLAWKKGLNFYQRRSNSIILCNTLRAYCIPKDVLMTTGEIIYEKVYASPRPLLRRLLFKTIGGKNWVQKLLDVVKTTNQPNQTLIQFIERWDLLWQHKRPVRVLRKSIHVSLFTARIPICLLSV